SSSTATGTTASDTLSLHDALPIYDRWVGRTARRVLDGTGHTDPDADELAHVAPGLFEELLRGARRPAEHLERPGRDRCLGPPCRKDPPREVAHCGRSVRRAEVDCDEDARVGVEGDARGRASARGRGLARGGHEARREE